LTLRDAETGERWVIGERRATGERWATGDRPEVTEGGGGFNPRKCGKN